MWIWEAPWPSWFRFSAMVYDWWRGYLNNILSRRSLTCQAVAADWCSSHRWAEPPSLPHLHLWLRGRDRDLGEWWLIVELNSKMIKWYFSILRSWMCWWAGIVYGSVKKSLFAVYRARTVYKWRTVYWIRIADSTIKINPWTKAGSIIGRWPITALSSHTDQCSLWHGDNTVAC